MAGQTINPTDIAKARASGYSDKEIADFLSTKAPDQFKAARSAGYSDGEILTHLSGDPAPAAAPSAPAPSGVFDGVQQGASDLIHGVGETAKQFAGVDNSSVEGAAKAVAPNNYVPAQVVPEGGHWYDPRTYNYSQIPQAVAEAAPGLATDIAAARIGAKVNPLVGAGAGIASYLLRTRGDTAKNDAAVRTGNPMAEPELQDKARALATGIPEALLQKVGVSRFLPGVAGSALSKVAKTAAVEGGVGAAQNAVSQAGATVGTDKGLTVDPSQVVGAGITSAATGGALALPRGLAEANANKRLAPLGGDNEDATKALVARVQQAAEGKKLAATAISGDTSNAFNALKTATGGVKDELKAAVKPIKAALDPDTANALKRASSADAAPLSEADLSNIEKNTSPDIAFLARQAHVSNLIKGMGDFGSGQFVGGITHEAGKRVSALTNPLGVIGKAAIAGGVGAAHGGAMVAYSPEAAALLGTVYTGLRGIDSFTGNRSPLDGVVKRFSDPNAQVRLPAPEAPQAPAVSPSGPKVPFNPGVAGGGTALALGQNPFAPPPSAPEMTPVQMNEQVKSALLMAAARRNIAAQQAPVAQKPDVSGMNEQVKSALLMAAARRNVAARRAALGLADESPLVQDNGGTSLLSNPAFAKAAGSLVSGAKAHAALTRQPEEDAAPVSPDQAPPTAPNGPTVPAAPGMTGPALALLHQLQQSGNPQPSAPEAPSAPASPVDAMSALAKISKKKGGQVKAEPAPEYTGDYVPLQDHELHGLNMSDRQFAEHASQAPSIVDKEAYKDGVIRDRVKRRGILADLSGDAPIEDQEHAGELLQQLHHIRRGATAAKAIKHYTEKMAPELRDAIRKRMDASFINSMWSK